MAGLNVDSPPDEFSLFWTAVACAFSCSLSPDCLSQAINMTGRLTSRRMAITERTTAGSNSMWGGRFAEGPASVMREINASIPFDKRLWRQDIAGSKAHVAMLAKQGIVSAEDAAAISGGPGQYAAEYEAGDRKRVVRGKSVSVRVN